MTGPTATDIEDKEATKTTAKELAFITEKANISVKNVPFRQVITSFSGLRAHEDGDDFVIGEAEDAENFFDAAGIESPGLTSAPAIGVYVAELVAKESRSCEEGKLERQEKRLCAPRENEQGRKSCPD